MPTIKTRLIATHSGDDIGAKVSSEVSIHSFHPSRRGVTNLGHGAARYALFSIPRFPRESLATRHSRSVLQQAFVSITTTIYLVSRLHAHVYVCSIASYSRDHQPTVWRSQWTSYGLNALPHQLIVLFALVFRDARTSYHEIPIFRSAISDRRIFTHWIADNFKQCKLCECRFLYSDYACIVYFCITMLPIPSLYIIYI